MEIDIGMDSLGLSYDSAADITADAARLVYSRIWVGSDAAALSQLTGGRFVLGVGAGTVYEPAYRRAWGIGEHSSLALVRGYLQSSASARIVRRSPPIGW